jgi:hypothetical protein
MPEDEQRPVTAEELWAKAQEILRRLGIDPDAPPKYRNSATGTISDKVSAKIEIEYEQRGKAGA